jgi:hypothetical protein
VRKISIVSSQILGLVGASLGYLDIWHTSSRSALDGVKSAFGQNHGAWFWSHCGEIGFILIAAAFLIQFILTITDHKEAIK